MKVSINKGIKFTSRTIDALVKASKVTHSTSIERGHKNKYGWIEVTHCNGYVFKNAKQFGIYLINLINNLSGSGIVDYTSLKNAKNVAGHHIFTIE
jgi:ketopantoate reductase